jgi:hypothetical protein
MVTVARDASQAAHSLTELADVVAVFGPCQAYQDIRDTSPHKTHAAAWQYLKQEYEHLVAPYQRTAGGEARLQEKCQLAYHAFTIAQREADEKRALRRLLMDRMAAVRPPVSDVAVSQHSVAGRWRGTTSNGLQFEWTIDGDGSYESVYQERGQRVRRRGRISINADGSMQWHADSGQNGTLSATSGSPSPRVLDGTISGSRETFRMTQIIGRSRTSGNTNALAIPPMPTRRVNDYASVVSATERQQLEAVLAEFEQVTKAQMVIAIFSSLQGEDLESYTKKVSNQWGIGRTGADDGIVLFLFAAERRMRLEIGKGLENIVTDSIAAGVLREAVGRDMREGRVGAALDKAVNDVYSRVLAQRPSAQLTASGGTGALGPATLQTCEREATATVKALAAANISPTAQWGGPLILFRITEVMDPSYRAKVGDDAYAERLERIFRSWRSCLRWAREVRAEGPEWKSLPRYVPPPVVKLAATRENCEKQVDDARKILLAAHHRFPEKISYKDQHLWNAVSDAHDWGAHPLPGEAWARHLQKFWGSWQNCLDWSQDVARRFGPYGQR